jgi:ribosomal protein L32
VDTVSVSRRSRREDSMITVTSCPVCGKSLKRVSNNSCFFYDDQRVCVEMNDCEHYEWKRISNGCYNNPDIDVCRGTDELLRESIDIVRDGTTVWLLVPRGIMDRIEEY